MPLKKLMEQCKTYQLCIAAYDEAELNARQITEAVKGRLLAERNADTARAAELVEFINDAEQGEVSRRMAVLQLERLRAKTYCVHEEEADSFNAAIYSGKQAVDEMDELRRTIRETFGDVDKRLRELREATLGDRRADLYSRWLERDCVEFDHLEETL